MNNLDISILHYSDSCRFHYRPVESEHESQITYAHHQGYEVTVKKLTPFPLQLVAQVGCPAKATESDTHSLF